MKFRGGNPVVDGINDPIIAFRLCFINIGPLGFGFHYDLPIYYNGGVSIPPLERYPKPNHQ